MKQTSSTLQETTLTFNGKDYNCALELDCSVTRYDERHSRYYQESRADIECELCDLSARLDGVEAEDKETLRQLRILAREWVNENADKTCERLGL